MSSLPVHPQYEDSEDEQLAAEVKNLSEKEKKELLASSDSILSATTDDGDDPKSFNPTKTLHINASGIGVLRLPMPSSELEIPIYTPTGELAYTSTREKRSSGNAVLSAPGRGDLVSSVYRFGPGREPKLVMLKHPRAQEGEGEVTVAGKWTSRTQLFKYAAGQVEFVWRYKREGRERAGLLPVAAADEEKKSRKQKKVTLVTLEVHGFEKGDIRRIAQLVRGDEARTPGTKSCSAGNGGELMIDEMAAQALGIPEELIVSSCIMMLKKEIDRRRSVQMMVIAAAVS